MMSLNGGYAMIKHNSTQEELQIAYRSKRPVLFYDENQRAHWAVIEETATQSVDEETQEPITLYEYSYRLIDEASEVVANPTLSGNEATLDGLEVDGTKYKVGGGSEVHLYQHLIKFTSTNHPTIETTRLSTSNTPFTKNTFFAYTGGNIYSNFTQCPVYSSNTIKYTKGAYETPGASYKAIIDTYELENGVFTKSTNEVSLGTIEDMVIQIL